MPGNSANNGAVAGSASSIPPAVNRKKQKRRAKQAAKQAAEQGRSAPGGVPHPDSAHVSQGGHSRSLPAAHPDHGSADFDGPDLDDHHTAGGPDDVDDSDAELADDPHLPSDLPNGHPDDATNGTKKKSKKKKKKSKSGPSGGDDPHAHGAIAHLVGPAASDALRPKHGKTKDRIWNTSTQEERERIKEFWLSLGEEERKTLVKIEKDAVMRKMKEQQKHSCSCTVCGRKRVAIEEELEVLYDAYYDELEQYAHHQHMPTNGIPAPHHPVRQNGQQHIRLPPDRMQRLIDHATPGTSQAGLVDDDLEDDEEEDLDDDEYSDEEYEEYSDVSEEIPRGPAADFLNFGNSLTVKGGILTVADDLLKNDGKKFIEMMEQLAERRMQREEEAIHAAASMMHSHGGHTHTYSPDDDEYDDEEDDDEYSDEEYEEDEEMDAMTEEQRMEEGRRMFQIFAARMFEQRVLTAYREKVAQERQQKLLEEIQEEERLGAERDAKKARDAQKRKDKKLQQKQAKAEEKARRDAEKAAEEAAAKAAEAQKAEEQRKKREEQKRKKEAEKKAQEEERLKKEAERLRRQQEIKERQLEAQRKQAEAKAQEKKARDEARKKERDEREAREKDAKEKKLQEAKERKQRGAVQQADASLRLDAQGRKGANQAAQISQASLQAQAAKRPSQPAVAIPPGLHKPPSSFGSPAIPVATPAMGKVPTPGLRVRQGSQQGSHTTPPKTPNISSATSKSASPNNAAASHPVPTPRSILQRPSQQQLPSASSHSSSPPRALASPPGLPVSQVGPGFTGPTAFGVPGQPQSSTPEITPSPQGGPNASPFIAHQHPMGPQFRPMPPYGLPGQGPPGLHHPLQPPMPGSRAFDPPPGFPSPLPHMSNPVFNSFGPPPGIGKDIPQTHSRQQSGSYDGVQGASQPISRPAPIQRPSSVKPQEHDGKSLTTDIDDLSRHLGSSALLDDADDPYPGPSSGRCPSVPMAIQQDSRPGMYPMPSMFGREPSPPGSQIPGSTVWSTPPLANAFGSAGLMSGLTGSSAWGAGPANPWPAPTHHRSSRPVTIRLLACQACRTLSASGPRRSVTAGVGESPGTAAKKLDGYHDVRDVYTAIQKSQPLEIGQITHTELMQIFETEGDANNGGGTFYLQSEGDAPDTPWAGPGEDQRTLVKWEPDATTQVPGFGVGSPLVGLGAAPGLGSGPSHPFGSPLGAPLGPGMGLGLQRNSVTGPFGFDGRIGGLGRTPSGGDGSHGL